MSNKNLFTSGGNLGKNGFRPQYITPKRDIRDGYQPTQPTTTQQSGGNSGTNRPSPPSGGSGVPDKSN